MNSFPFLLFTLLQADAPWRLDLLSLIVGFVIGVALTLAVARLVPIVWQWRAQLLTRLRETQAWVRSGVENRFQAETAAYVQKYHLDGRLANLEQIFVEPRLRLPESDIEPEALNGSAPDQLQYLWPELTAGLAIPPAPGMTVRQLLLSGRRVALVAEAGAGKTTLLAYCAHLCAGASETGPYTFLLPVIPIFVHLAELDFTAKVSEGAITPGEESDSETVAAPAGDPEPSDPVSPLTRALQQRSGPLTSSGVDNLLRQKLASGQALLLLDGLDELPVVGRPAVINWLQRLLTLYPEVQVIAAAPLTGYGSLLDLAFISVGLFPWRAGQAETYGDRWADVLSQKTLRLRQYWQPGQSTLLTALRLRLAYEEETTYGQERPQRLLDLMEAMLCRLLPQVETDPPWLAPASRELWQQAAYHLLIHEKVSLGRGEMASLMENILAEYEVEERTAVTALQKSLAQSGLFSVWHNHSVTLLSPVWRDFLAAAYLSQTRETEMVREHLGDPYWAGVLRFYVGRVGAAEWVPALLEVKQPDPLHERLFQVASWMPEALDQGEWRRQIMIRLGQIIIKSNLPLVLRQRAVLSLAQTGEAGVLAFLRQLLRQPDPFMRQAAIAALGRQEAEVALDLLDKMITDGEAGVRRASVHVLAWLHDPATEKPLLMSLLDQDDALNRAAAEGVALNGGEELEILKEALGEEALHVRRAAVHGLSLIDQHWVMLLLDKTVRQDDQWVIQAAATEALEVIAARNRPAKWRRPQIGDQSWLVEWAARQGRAVPAGAAALAVLLEALANAEQTPIRVAAAVSLGQFGTPENIPALKSALRDPETQVREVAFASLCRLSRVYETGL